METKKLLENYEQYIELGIRYAGEYGLKIFFALIIFYVGRRVAKMLTNVLVKTMEVRKVDEELVGFLSSLVYWGLVVLVVLAALGQLGIQTASFIAVLGAAGLAIGLALQGSLSNFAAGVLLILLRPFNVGHFVEVAGESGSVKKISIFTTELRTPDNKCVIIPNSRILDGNIINYSSTGRRRVDLEFGVGYDDDIDKVRQIITDVLSKDDRVLDTPEPQIAVSMLADSSVNFIVRPWAKTGDYWDLHFALIEEIKKQFDKHGITIPYPQQVLHGVAIKSEKED